MMVETKVSKFCHHECQEGVRCCLCGAGEGACVYLLGMSDVRNPDDRVGGGGKRLLLLSLGQHAVLGFLDLVEYLLALLLWDVLVLGVLHPPHSLGVSQASHRRRK
jgi:hypothetical protein